jgi:hypothetical protein
MERTKKIIKLAAMVLKEKDSLYFKYGEGDRLESFVINDDRVGKYIKKLFNDFLTRKNAKHRFYNNIPNDHSIENFLYCPPNLISTGFPWALTSEGQTYWSKLHSEWGELLDKNIYDPLEKYMVSHQSK